MSTSILIDPSLLPALRKIQFLESAVKSLNDQYAEIVRNSPITSSPLPKERADKVARWTVDFAMGVEVLPLNKNAIVRFPGHQAIDANYPAPASGTADAAGILSRASETTMLKDLMARVFATTQEYQSGPDNENPSRFQPLPSYVKDCFEFDFATASLLRLSDQKQSETALTPEWNANPDKYKFPPGYPRTLPERQLSFQIIYLLAAFAARANSIGKALVTRGIRSESAFWRIPEAKDVDWQDVKQRQAYLDKVDDSLNNHADWLPRGVLRTGLEALFFEAPKFLVACRRYVGADPAIFEQYWAGQLKSIIYESYRNLDSFVANQRFIVTLLKQRLEAVNFDPEKSTLYVSRALEQQEHSFSDLLEKDFFWKVAGPSMGGLLSFSVYLDGVPEPYGAADPSWPDKEKVPAYGPTLFQDRS